MKRKLDPPPADNGEDVDVVISSKQRGKSQAKKDHDMFQEYSCIKMKSNTIFRQPMPSLMLAIQNSVWNWNKMAMEAYFLAGLHYIRCFKQDVVEIADLDQSFFRSCCSIVSDSKKSIGNVELTKTFDEYYEKLRPKEEYVVPQMKNMSKLISNLSKQMETAAINHVVLDFVKKLSRFIRFKYDLQNNSEGLKFIRSAYYNKDSRTDQEKEMVAWIGEEFNPLHEDNIKKNLVHFLRKMYDMNEFMESISQDTKGRRTFSLLPLKKGFGLSNILLTASTLPCLLQQIEVEDRRLIIQAVLDTCTDMRMKLILENSLSKPKVTIDDEMFNTKNEWISHSIWRYLFVIEKSETRNRTFAYGLSTDGYSVSLRFQKPMTEEKKKVVIRELKMKKEAIARRKEEIQDTSQSTTTTTTKKRKKQGGVVTVAENDEDEDHDESEFDRLPSKEVIERDYGKIYSMDPGLTFPATAFGGEVDPKTRKSIICQVSAKECFHLSKTTAFTKWELNLRKDEPDYDDILKRIPSFKTVDLERFQENIKLVLRDSDYLFGFHFDQNFRKWRFKRYVNTQKMLHKVCTRLTENDHETKKKVLIGFGDWSQQDGLKGLKKAPVKKLRRELRKYATVVKIDEYLTSQTCSACGSKAKKIKEWKVDKRDGVMKKSECHQVVRCTNELCTECWQRDVNASRNIYDLLMCLIKGEPRPLALCRPTKETTSLPD